MEANLRDECFIKGVCVYTPWSVYVVTDKHKMGVHKQVRFRKEDSVRELGSMVSLAIQPHAACFKADFRNVPRDQLNDEYVSVRSSIVGFT